LQPFTKKDHQLNRPQEPAHDSAHRRCPLPHPQALLCIDRPLAAAQPSTETHSPIGRLSREEGETKRKAYLKWKQTDP